MKNRYFVIYFLIHWFDGFIIKQRIVQSITCSKQPKLWLLILKDYFCNNSNKK